MNQKSMNQKPDQEAQQAAGSEPLIQDLAMMLRTCAWALRRGTSPDLGERALELLKRNDLLGSPLREQEPPKPQAPAPDYSDMSREALERHATRMAQALHDDKARTFYDKHALGPMMAPSCLVCGQLPDKVAIQHMELPGVVVCEKCRTAAKPQAPAVAVPARLPYATGNELWLAAHGGAKFLLHYHSHEPAPALTIRPDEHGVWVTTKRMGLPVHIYPNGSSKEGPGIYLTATPQAPAEPPSEDTKRLDWIEAQWRDGIHVECCATGGPTVHGLRKTVTVYFADKACEGADIRDAIDGAIAATKETPADSGMNSGDLAAAMLRDGAGS
jgi:hypothetical protein